MCRSCRRSFHLCGNTGTISVPRGARQETGEIIWPQKWWWALSDLALFPGLFFFFFRVRGKNRVWYTLIVHALKCPGIPMLHHNIIRIYVRIMGVVIFWRSLVHSCFERRAAPGHSTIYEGRDVFVCVSPQVVSWRHREESVPPSASLPGWLAFLIADQVETLRKRGMIISSQSGISCFRLEPFFTYSVFFVILKPCSCLGRGIISTSLLCQYWFTTS